jgi:hypothetical protein
VLNFFAVAMRLKEPAAGRDVGISLKRRIAHAVQTAAPILWRTDMGRGILLWLLGVPIPIIILLALIWH